MEEQELEELEKNSKFKTFPLNKKNLENDGSIGIKLIEPKPLTIPKVL